MPSECAGLEFGHSLIAVGAPTARSIPARASGPGRCADGFGGMKARPLTTPAHIVSAAAPRGTGLQPYDAILVRFLGRWPRLEWTAPSALTPGSTCRGATSCVRQKLIPDQVQADRSRFRLVKEIGGHSLADMGAQLLPIIPPR